MTTVTDTAGHSKTNTNTNTSNNTSTDTPQILVIGATGKTGRRVVSQLREKGLNVREGSRHSSPAFDWHNRDTWQPALTGIRSVYITYFPDLAMPQAPADINDFCELATAAGVEHLVLLSGRGEPEAQHCETIVQQSGLDWTLVRASWFNQNFSEGAFIDMILGGMIALPVNETGEPFIDANDIAEVVVAALTDARHRNQLYEVTGPELLSFAQLAQIFTREADIPVQFQSISLETFHQQLTQDGMPDSMIAMLEYLFTEVLDGRNAYTTDGVERALGRAARSFADYVRAAAHNGAWEQTADRATAD